jgi:hypothetical protein
LKLLVLPREFDMKSPVIGKAFADLRGALDTLQDILAPPLQLHAGPPHVIVPVVLVLKDVA